MTKNLALILGVVLSVSCFQANAAEFVEFGRSPKGSGEDAEIIKVVEQRRHVDFVEGRGMIVTKLLPDDNSGLKHQKWVVRLSNGTFVHAVYNLDMCERVELKVGDAIAMGGEFVWTGQGAMLHWLHFDPRQNRPDGYVEVNGKVYCGDGERRH